MPEPLWPVDYDNVVSDFFDDSPMEDLHPEHHNAIADSINQLQYTLGLNPQGAEANLAARLAQFDLDAINKLPIYNVTDPLFGAAADLADNSVAVQACIDYLRTHGGGRIYIPELLKMQHQVIVPWNYYHTGWHLFGKNKGSSGFRWNGADLGKDIPMVLIQGFPAYSSIGDMQLYGNVGSAVLGTEYLQMCALGVGSLVYNYNTEIWGGWRAGRLLLSNHCMHFNNKIYDTYYGSLWPNSIGNRGDNVFFFDDYTGTNFASLACESNVGIEGEDFWSCHMGFTPVGAYKEPGGPGYAFFGNVRLRSTPFEMCGNNALLDAGNGTGGGGSGNWIKNTYFSDFSWNGAYKIAGMAQDYNVVAGFCENVEWDLGDVQIVPDLYPGNLGWFNFKSGGQRNVFHGGRLLTDRISSYGKPFVTVNSGAFAESNALTEIVGDNNYRAHFAQAGATVTSGKFVQNPPRAFTEANGSQMALGFLVETSASGRWVPVQTEGYISITLGAACAAGDLLKCGTTVVGRAEPATVGDEIVAVALQAGSAGGAIAAWLCMQHGELDGDKVKTITTTPYTLLPRDKVVLIDSSGGNRVVTLPAVANNFRGKLYIIKRITAGANTVSINAASIDGVSTKSLTTQYESVTLTAGPTEWHVV